MDRVLAIYVLILFGSCTDCNDLEWYIDRDGDGFGTAQQIEYSCEPIEGYVTNDFDSDDNCNPRDWNIYYEDFDQDGLGNRLVKVFSCDNQNSTNFVSNGYDIDDDNAEKDSLSFLENKIIEFFEGFEITSTKSLKCIVPYNPDGRNQEDKGFIQHSVQFGEGEEAYSLLFEGVDKKNKVHIMNLFVDRPYVIAHILYEGRWNNRTPQVSLEVFRFQNDLIVEHWDNIENITSPVQRPQNIARLTGSTDANKELIRQLNSELFISKNTIDPKRYFSDDFVDYSSRAITLDDISSVTVPEYAETKFIHGQDNLVLSMSEGIPIELDSTIFTYFDLYEFDGDLIKSRWQTIQELPNFWLHDNGKW